MNNCLEFEIFAKLYEMLYFKEKLQVSSMNSILPFSVLQFHKYWIGSILQCLLEHFGKNIDQIKLKTLKENNYQIQII